MKKTYIMPCCKHIAMAETISILAGTTQNATNVNPGDNTTSDIKKSDDDDEWVGAKHFDAFQWED